MEARHSQTEARETETESVDVFEFDVKSDIRFIPGLGESGRRVVITEWRASPFGVENCPQCGYDRVEHTEHVHPEAESDHEWECRHCGHTSADIEAHRAQVARDHRLTSHLRKEWDATLEEGDFSRFPGPTEAYEILVDEGHAVLANTDFTEEDLYGLDRRQGW